jgi:hypothetical protein
MRKPSNSTAPAFRRILLSALVGVGAGSAGLFSLDRIVYQALNQVASATAKCGEVESNLRFAADARVALFVQEHVPPSFWIAGLVASLATFLALTFADRPKTLKESEVEALREAIAQSSYSVSEVCDVIRNL